MEVGDDHGLLVVGDSAFVEVDASEGARVEVAPGFVAGLGVDLSRFAEQFGVEPDMPGSQFELLGGLAESFGGGSSLEVDVAQSLADALLGHGLVSREVEEALLLLVELRHLRCEGCVELLGVPLGVSEPCLEGFAELVEKCPFQFQGAVVVGDVPLDFIDWQVGQVAFAVEAGPALVVLVGSAVALGFCVDEPGFAPLARTSTAVQQPLQVVVEDPVADARLGAVFDHLLHTFEELGAHDGFVPPFEGLSLVGHESDVVRVLEEAVDLAQ